MSEQLAMFDLEAGRGLRDEVLDALANMPGGFLELARRYAYRYAEVHGMVTSDDVRRWANTVGLEPDSPKQWGALFMDKGWVKIGYTQTAIKTSHARPIGVWKYDHRHN